MADATDVLAIPFPEGGDAFSAAIVAALAARLDEVPGVESLTGAEIAALGAALKPAGRVVYNSTTGKVQVSNGTSFVNIDAAALLLTGGTMTGDIVMSGGKTVTGLPAADANGEAVRYEQLTALGVWQSYTPTLTASTTNPTNWTQTGRYTRIGDTVVASFKLTAGASMTAGSGVYYAALPVAADTTVAASGLPVGQARAVGFGASIWTPAVVLEDAGKVRFDWPANIAGSSQNSLAHNVPWAWAATDTLAATITYEAA